MVGFGLQSAIREQRRDRKYITLDYVEAESDNLVYEIDQFSTKSGRLSPSVAESEDFDVINEWIREPDCTEMMSNAETNQSSQEDGLGGTCDNSNNSSMEDGDCRIVANAAENESRGVIDTEERKPICEEFGQSSAKIENPPNEVENVEVKFGMVCLDGHAVGNDGEILSQKPPTECPAGQGTVFPIHIQSGTTSSNGVSEISVDNSCTHLEVREESIEYISPSRTKGDTKELVAKNPSFFEGQEAKEPKREEKMGVPLYEESEVESGEIVSENDGRDCIGIVESDSDTSSDSSSRGSHDEDEEEGEIRSSNGRRIPRANSLDEMLGSSDEEGPKGGPIRSMHELQALPPVPPVNVVLEDHHQALPLGTISSVLSGIVLVEGTECHRPLDEGSILWITETRLPLGFIDELFGPVKNPYYVVRFNSAADVPKYVREGTKVSYVSEFATCALNDPSLYKKGYDASGDYDEELSEEVEFSDDEKEAEYKRTRLKAKREADSRENMQGMDYGKIGKSRGLVDKRKNKNRCGRSREAGNHAHCLEGEAQEFRFASKKPFQNRSKKLFQNRSRVWNSSVGAKQSKDCSESQGPAPPCMPPTGQSAGSQLTPINNIAQQSPQHFDPTSGSLSQAVTPGPPTDQMQFSVDGGQSTGQFNANSPGFFHWSHEAANHAHCLKGEAQEFRFASKKPFQNRSGKPFQNRSRGWNSSVGAKQSKDCSESQGPAPPCVPPTGQSAGSQPTPINNIAQQSPQHFDPTRGSLSQAVTPVAYTGPPTDQVQFSVDSGQSTGQFNSNSPGFFHWSHEAGNHAHCLKGEAQEFRFASKKPFQNRSKKPFQNRSRGWNSSVGAKQSKDCSESQGPAPPCMPPTGQSTVSQLTPINNIAQQSPQHFDPSGSLSQAVTPVAYTGPPTDQVQFSVDSGQSTGQFNANSPGFFHSRPLHGIAGGIPMGHLPTSLLQDPAGGIHLGQPNSRPLHESAGGTHLGQPQVRPLHDTVGGACLLQGHSRPLHDPAEGIQIGQPNSRPPLQDTVTGIPLGQPHSKPLHNPAGVIHLGQLPMFGALMLNGNQINTNPLDLYQRPTHPVYMGSPLHDNSIHPRMPFSDAGWNAGPPNHLAEGSQLQSSDANQGVISPLHYNKTQTCFGAPLSHHPGSFAPSYGNMGMNTFCNTGPFPGQNVMSCPMPWGQFAPIIQGNLNWQYQNCVPLDGGSIPISQPNNTMPVNAPRPPLPHGPPPRGANFGRWRPN